MTTTHRAPVRPGPTSHAVLTAIDEPLADLLAFAERLDLDQLWLLGDGQPTTRTADGWRVTWREGDWWIRGYRPGRDDRAIVLPARNSGAGAWDCWADAPDADTLNVALTRFVTAVGQLPERSPGSTAHRLLRQAHRGPGATICHPSERLTERVQSGIGPLIWMQQPGLMPRGLYLHSYDKHGMYLAACSSLALGSGVPELYEGTALQHALTRRPLAPGYWWASVDGWGSGPPPVDARRPRWYPTPAMSYLLNQPEQQIDCAAAWLWPSSYRPLEPWYAKLREARLLLQARHDAPEATAIALSAVKSIYTQGIGWFAAQAKGWDRSQDAYYRPDWFDAIMTAARANLLRNIAASTLDPIAVQVDCLYVLSDNPDADAEAQDNGLRLGPGLGQYAVKDRAIPAGEVQVFLDAGDLGGLSRYLNERAGRR